MNSVLLVTLVSMSIIVLEAALAFGEEDKDIGHIGAYPTNFFKDIVPRFVNDRPVIGILSIGLDGDKTLQQEPYLRDKGYYGASYVKFIEAAGARAVTIREDISSKNLKHLLRKINGVIVPGNDADTGDAGYYKVMKKILAFSKKQFNKDGEKFPILAICRGAERMMMAISGKDFSLLGDAKNLSIPLILTNEVKKSQLLGNAPDGLVKAISKKPLAFYYQDMVMPLANFYNNTNLKSSLRLLATNTDRNGTEFISTYEGRKLPWYGISWHPEKPQYVFNPTLSIDHSIYSVILSQYIANFFISQARQNPNRFDSRQEEESFLVYKDFPQYVGNITESQYEQIYTHNLKMPPAKPVTEDDQEDGRKKKSKRKEFD